MENKLVSIVVPVYNSEDYIKKTLDSLVNQTYKNLEIILINDCSTDSTEKIIRSYDDDRIIILNNEQNMGISKTLNKGISHANGDYIARMDSDDICSLNRIQQQVEFLETHNDIDVCGSFVKTFGLKERVSIYPVTSDEIRINVMFGCCMAHPTVMFRRRIIEDFVYNPSIKVEDYDLWLSLIKKGYKFYNIPEALLNYRIHETSLSFIKVNDDKRRKLVEDYKSTISRANTELIGVNLSEKEIEELFLHSDMVSNFNLNMKSLLDTFERYYNNCLRIMNKKDIEILKKALSLKFYEKAVILSKNGQITNTIFRKATFNIYRNSIKKNLVLIYLASKGLKSKK